MTLIVTKKRMNCFAGNSAILPSSCYEMKPLFTKHYRFWSQQHIFRRKSVFTRQIRRSWSCLQITFSRNAETIIAMHACETVDMNRLTARDMDHIRGGYRITLTTAKRTELRRKICLYTECTSSDSFIVCHMHVLFVGAVHKLCHMMVCRSMYATMQVCARACEPA